MKIDCDLAVRQISTYVPPFRYSTDEMIERFRGALSDEVIRNIQNLGVKRRFLAFDLDDLDRRSSQTSEPIVAGCTGAGLDCLNRGGIKPAEVHYLLVASDESDYLCPGLSNILLSRLGLSPFINHLNLQGLACAAIPKAFDVAADHLSRFPDHRILLILSGINSGWFAARLAGVRNALAPREIKKLKSSKERQRELRSWITVIEGFLFGDGAAAMILERPSRERKDQRILNVCHVTNLRTQHYRAGFVKLIDAKALKDRIDSNLEADVPRLGLRYAKAVISKLRSNQGERSASFMSSVKKWVVHTGSVKIIDAISKAFTIDRSKIQESYDVLAEFGNLSGASPSFIMERVGQRNGLRQGDLTLTVAFGWGFSAGGCLMKF